MFASGMVGFCAVDSMNTILYFTITSTRGGAANQLRGAAEEASRSGAHLQRIGTSPTREFVRNLTRLWNPLGAIVDCAWPWFDVDPGLFGSLPVAMIGHSPETLPRDVPNVLHDSGEAGREAALELLATGFQNVAYVAPGQHRHWSDARRDSFVRTMRIHGIQCESIEGLPEYFDDPLWQKRIRALLTGLPKPCAVFAATDIVGAEVLAAARFCGIDVPGELAVVAVDDNEDICERLVPTLSSVRPDFHHAGVLAVRALLSVVRGGPKAARTLSFGNLGVVRRASTRPLAVNDAVAARALEFIRREACSGLRPARVVALFPCSRQMAGYRFRKAVGHTIGEEIHARQLEEAKRLLADPTRQLKVVSDFCGFGSPGSLRNFFRRETGMSLSAWRKRADRDHRQPAPVP